MRTWNMNSFGRNLFSPPAAVVDQAGLVGLVDYPDDEDEEGEDDEDEEDDLAPRKRPRLGS